MALYVRKMLGRHDMPCIERLMRQVEKQSKTTIAHFAFDFVRDRFIPFYEERFGNDLRLDKGLAATSNYLSTGTGFKEAKAAILDVHAAAREADGDPVKQAVLRAIGQGLSAIHTPTHVLGIVFYGAAALAYDSLGIGADKAEYDHVVETLANEVSTALADVSVDNEENPCMPEWYC